MYTYHHDLAFDNGERYPLKFTVAECSILTKQTILNPGVMSFTLVSSLFEFPSGTESVTSDSSPQKLKVGRYNVRVGIRNDKAMR